jgi:hypothetical protein
VKELAGEELKTELTRGRRSSWRSLRRWRRLARDIGNRVDLRKKPREEEGAEDRSFTGRREGAQRWPT